MANAFVGAIRKVYPFISAAAGLGGPFGVMAASAVGKAIGVDKVDPSCDAIHDAIASAMGDDTKRLALLQQEQSFSLQMAELGYKNATDLEEIAEKDRESARNREIQVRDWMPKVLSILAVISLLACIALLAFLNLPPGGRDAILILLGAVVASYKDVYGYYLGSSAGSAAKDQTISKIASGN